MAGTVRFAGWRTVEEGKKLSENEEPKPGRVYTMYHGTHVDNAEVIIINGFKPSTKGMLGKGVYVSRNIEKAKCYPLRTDKRDQVVFKLKVNVGKVIKIDIDNHPLRTTCNISVIKSGREEDCVWDPDRITVIDLRDLIRTHTRNNECPLCRQSAPTLPHELHDCWECGGRICPFEREHVCMTQGNSQL
ncbi:hypothetical protein Q7C36_022637 [Tachysurus vachellii]|uniref:PARP catalytic domain-containing protein n=1 Tax=Tachysurus vachellii TaxID=175792 RepID=A0AA88ILR7_TACVA|nr:hypothetical protein Q7C36_022637 [Tachysurus vachellii]